MFVCVCVFGCVCNLHPLLSMHDRDIANHMHATTSIAQMTWHHIRCHYVTPLDVCVSGIKSFAVFVRQCDRTGADALR